MTYKRLMTLPTDSAERKQYPLYSGVLAYFPAALAGVARVSKQGNDKHNPGQPMHHARGKSTDHADCILRHLTDTNDLLRAYEHQPVDNEPGCVSVEQVLLEASQLAWRVLAYSQELHERFGAPLAPGAVEAMEAPKQDSFTAVKSHQLAVGDRVIAKGPEDSKGRKGYVVDIEADITYGYKVRFDGMAYSTSLAANELEKIND